MEKDSEDKILKITIGESNMFLSFKEWELNQDFNNWREYLLWKYPSSLLFKNPGYRIPDKENEEDSFENWKLKDKSKASLFGYGTLTKDEPSKEFVNMIMKK